MFGIHLAEKVPFRTVYLHGLVKDPSGKRMAKTKGNVVDPLHAIDESGRAPPRLAPRPNARNAAALRPGCPAGLAPGGAPAPAPRPRRARPGRALDPVAD